MSSTNVNHGTPATELVWVITGTSTGIGRALALAALSRGDKVIATARARSLHKLDDLKKKGMYTMELDVSDTLESLKRKAEEAVGVWGRVDVVVNNAGYMTVGAMEEITPEETLDLYQTNVFGGLNVSRAFLPYMRERKSGTVVFVGSVGGWMTAPVGGGMYWSTKYAIRGISECLHNEISHLGLRSICFDFGSFRTEILTASHRNEYDARIEDYAEPLASFETLLKVLSGSEPGDPNKGAQVVVDVVKGEGAARGKPTPTVVALGADAYQTVKEYSEKTIQRVEEWKEVSLSTGYQD